MTNYNRAISLLNATATTRSTGEAAGIDEKTRRLRICLQSHTTVNRPNFR